MKRLLFAAIAAAFCFAPAADAQADFTATAIMLTMMSMNQPPPAPDADTGDYSKFHKVAVLAALNGSMPFDGDGKDGVIDISAWNVNTQMTELLRKYLAGRFEFADVPVDPGALAKNARSQRTLKPFLKTLPDSGVDAYIVVRPVDGGYSEPGIALHTGWEQGGATLYVNYEIDIIDARRLSVVGSAEARLRTREPQRAFYPAHAVENIDKAALIAGKDPEALERVHRTLTWSLQMSAVETLRALEAGAELPPVGDHGIALPQLAGTMSKYRNVAVASALGEDLRFVVGGHLFVNKKDVVLPGLLPGIDAKVEAIASEVLARHHTVKPAAFDRALLAGAGIPASGKMGPVAGLPASQDIDAYVLFLKAPLEGDGGLAAGGIGATHWIPVGDSSLSVFTNAGIVVIDAHTMAVVDTTALHPGPKDICGQASPFIVRGINCQIDEKKFAPKTPETLSGEAKTAIREAAEKVLADAIPETLFGMGLDSPAVDAAK
jgi:hypothetical protein